MTQWLTPLELADARLPGLPAQQKHVSRLAVKRGWRKARSKDGSPLARKVGKGWAYHISLLPAEAQARLVKDAQQQPQANIELERSAVWARYDRLKAKAKATAENRLAMLTQVQELQNSGMTKSVAVNMVAAEGKASARSIHSWFGLVAGLHQTDWLPALAPHHTGRTTQTDCPPDAWSALKTDYLRLSRPSFETCYERLSLMAREHGWQLPASRTLKRRIEKEIPKPVIVKLRQGEDALKRMYPAQERTRDHYHAMEAVNIDGHKWDVFVRWPDGTIARPMMVAIQDLYSNKIVAWRVDYSENTDAVRLAFRDLFENFGIPRECYLDNGRAFASKYISGGAKTRFRFKVKPEEPTGILTALNIKLHWTTPYSGQSKPIERAFRDLCDSVAKHPAFEGAYTGNKPDAKPENYGSKAVDLSRFVEIVEQGIALHNARPNRRTQVCAGLRSFDQAFDESYGRATIPQATEEQLRLCLLAAESVRSARIDGALKLLGNRFWSPCLHETAGTPVVVRFDPDALHAGVYVYRLDESYVGYAECIEAVGFDSVAAAKEHSRKRREFVRKTREVADLELDMSVEQLVALQPYVETPDAPAANVTRLVRPNTHQPTISGLRRPVPTAAPLSEEERARVAEIEAEMESGQNIVSMPETPKRRYARLLDVERRAEAGCASADEIKWMEAYMASAEYRTNRSFHEDFGADWLEA